MSRTRSIGTLVLAGLVVLTSGHIAKAETITFDDINLGYYSDRTISNGYHGLNWTNFNVLDASQLFANYGANGYTNGLVSGSNVAFNSGGNPASIRAQSTLFTLNSFYLTSAWRDGLNVAVTGYNASNNVIDSANFTVDASSPSLFELNWAGVSRVEFVSSGGASAGYGGIGTNFVIDNMRVNEPVPEVGTIVSFGVVLASGGLFMLRRLRRK